MKKWGRHIRRTNSSGFTMISFLVIALIIGGSIALMLTYVRNITRETQRHSTSTEAFNAAEAGLRRALFMLQAKETWTYFTTNTTVGWTTLSGGAAYTFAFSNITADAITVTATGRKCFEKGYAYRKIQADVAHPIPEAFGYALFGNKVGFHNHMSVNYGLAITSDIFSNDDVEFWRGLTLDGNITAVGRIIRLANPAACSASIINGTFLDGTPGSEFYAPTNKTGIPQPVPSPIPYPEYDFAAASNTAVASGTYFASAAAFQTYIAAHTTTWVTNPATATATAWSNRQAYAFPSPLPSNPTNTLFLTTADGTKTGIVSRAILSNALFYIKGDVTLSADCNTLLVITNSGVVVDGKFTVKRPFELYAEGNKPAIAATGKIDITDKDHTDGDGGPVNICGIIYTEGECHIHQSDAYNAVSVAGIEVASYVHNCEWFWFNYTAWPGVKGFSEGTGAQGLTMTKWHELPAGPP